MSSPPELVLVVAVARNNVIGVDNRLPWRLPEDLKHFKALTSSHTVVMGRKTWESLPENFRPLPGRHNIVVTRNDVYAANGATVVNSLAAALAAATDATAFVIGGAELYAQALPMATRLELTEIDASFEGDTFFPTLDRKVWSETARASHRSASGLDYAFVTYQRNQE